MQKLRILLYGDRRVTDSQAPKAFGLGDLIRFVSGGLKNVVDLSMEFVHRHKVGNKDVQGAHKLAWQFLDQYDELWIFGDKQVNVVGKDITKREPYNQLDSYEQEVLREWMKDRGLFFTGDHSDLDPNLSSSDPCAQDHSKFINLGASLGRFIPRVRQLRVWDGPPTNCSDPLSPDNQNTVDGPDPCKFDDDPNPLQFDGTPQVLVRPSTAHKLFSWINPTGEVMPITVFPDHQHEGRVLAPTQPELNSDWPAGSPAPMVVARGKDNRPATHGREYDLVVAFDGDPVNVGRIVADSSFHHYLNPNLEEIDGCYASGDPKPGSFLDQIAQYYCNLALWLAPKTIRDQLRIDLLSRLAVHPDVLMVRGQSIDVLGRAAKMTAAMEFGAGNTYQILGVTTEEGATVDAGNFFAEYHAELVATAAPTTETVLGSIVQEFHEYFFTHGMFSPIGTENIPAGQIIASGSVRAFNPQADS
jgi:hypothetical protein